MLHRPRAPFFVSTLVHASMIGVLWNATSTTWRESSTVLELDGQVSPASVPADQVQELTEQQVEEPALLLDPPPTTPPPILDEHWLPERDLVGEADFVRALDLVLDEVRRSPVPVRPPAQAEPARTAQIEAPPPVPEEDRASTDPDRPDPRAPLFAPNPPYPARALRLGLEGRVTFMVQVDPDGKVHDCTILESSGYLVLDASAQRCLLTWRFPSILPEREVRRIRVPVRFQMQG